MVLTLPTSAQVEPESQLVESEDAYMIDSLLEVHNALKLDPLQVLRGEILVFYERRVTDRVSLEVGLGLTRRNWAFALFDVDADDLRRNINVRTGPSARLGIRFYLKDSPELNGMYIMPQVAYKVYEKNFAELDSAGELNGVDHIDRREIGEFNVCFGYQHLSYNSNFFYDVYVGIGYAIRRGTEVSRLNLPVETRYASGPLNDDGPVPLIGVKLGWGF